MKAVCINRVDRPERLKASQEQFSKYGMDVEVFPAITNPRGWRGCRDSHLVVLEKYQSENFLLVFEDDVLFLADPTLPMAEAASELPPNWDMLYLGISPTQRYQRYSEHLFRVNGGYTTHAILWHNRKHGAVEYIFSHRNDILKWDVYLSSVIHKIFNCLVIWPLLCTQIQYKSDTCIKSAASSIQRNYLKFIG